MNLTTAPPFFSIVFAFTSRTGPTHVFFLFPATFPQHYFLFTLNFFIIFTLNFFIIFSSIFSSFFHQFYVFLTFAFTVLSTFDAFFFVSFCFYMRRARQKLLSKKRRKSVWFLQKNRTLDGNLDTEEDFSPLPLHSDCSRVPAWWPWRRSLAAGCVVPPCWAEGWGWWDFPPVRLGRRLILSRHFCGQIWQVVPEIKHTSLIRHFHTKIFSVLFGNRKKNQIK